MNAATAEISSESKYQQAVGCFQRREYEQAATLLSEALLQEQTSERWNDWATAKFLCGRTAEAEGGYRRALELEPENIQAVANLGSLLAGQERFSEAIPLLEFSLARGKAQQTDGTATLLAKCKEGLSQGVLGRKDELRSFCENFSKGMSLQTVSLDRLLFRMMNMENEMRRFGQQCTSAVEEMRGKLAAPQSAHQKLIPTVPLSAICKELRPVELHAPVGVDGNVSLYELVVITSLAKQRAPRSLFEIGTFDGRTALNLAANMPKDGRVFTLDLPKAESGSTGLRLGDGDKLYIEKERSGARFADTPWEGRITQLYGDSATFDYTPYENKMDFVFVDGSHSYEYVMNDSRKALSLLKDGKGIILWHDYPGWIGVADALNELFVKDKTFGRMRNIEHTAFAYLEI